MIPPAVACNAAWAPPRPYPLPAFATLAILLLALPAPALDRPPPDASPIPFLQYRDRVAADLEPSLPAALIHSVTEVRLAWFGPSDPDDPDHGDLWWSANLAVREANRRGGCAGKPFRLLPVWSTNPWGTGVAQLFRTVYDHQPWALLGGVDGPSTHLAEQVVAKTRLPLVSPVATDRSIDLAGVSWTFSCAPPDTLIMAQLADSIDRALRPDPDPASSAPTPRPQPLLALLTATDHDSRHATRDLLIALRRRNHHPAHRFDFAPNTLRFESQVAALTAAQPDALVLVAGPDDSARALLALRQAMPDLPVFGSHHLGRHRFARLAGPAAAGVIFPQLCPNTPAHPASETFAAAFRTRFDREPDYAAQLAHAATCRLIDAIQRAVQDRLALHEALRQTGLPPGLDCVRPAPRPAAEELPQARGAALP